MTKPIALLLLSGCASTCDGAQPTSLSQNGELGNGSFRYECGGINDALCRDETTVFPDCLVVGGRFGLTYELRDRSASNGGASGGLLRVESASPRFIAAVGEQFEVVRSGTSAMLARENDYILDVLHLDLVTPTSLRLELSGAGDIDRITVATGSSELVAVIPSAIRCTYLGGAIRVTVSGGDPDIARIDASDGLAITGVTPGATTFVIAAGELTRELTVTVEGAAATTGSTTTAAGAETGTTATTGTTSGANTTTGTTASGSGTAPGSSGTGG